MVPHQRRSGGADHQSTRGVGCGARRDSVCAGRPSTGGKHRPVAPITVRADGCRRRRYCSDRWRSAPGPAPLGELLEGVSVGASRYVPAGARNRSACPPSPRGTRRETFAYTPQASAHTARAPRRQNLRHELQPAYPRQPDRYGGPGAAGTRRLLRPRRTYPTDDLAGDANAGWRGRPAGGRRPIPPCGLGPAR